MAVLGLRRNAQSSPICDAASLAHLPPTPALPPPRRVGRIPSGSASLWFAEFGPARTQAPPILLLHGGMANADYWGAIIPIVLSQRRVLALDTRGHGRSTMGAEGLDFGLFARDTIQLLDQLGVARAAIAGWSDGGVIALYLAKDYPDRVAGLYTYGANFDPSGYRPGGSETRVFRAYAERAGDEYRRLSPEPQRLGERNAALRQLWRTEPKFVRQDLGRITTPTTVADGALDEVISQRHTAALASFIPNALLNIEPCAGHFALIQAPAIFASNLIAAFA